MMACIQAAHWFQLKVFAIAPLIAIKHNTDCSCSCLYPHTTVTTEAFSRKCTWTQNNAHSLVVLKQTRSLIHTISCRDGCRRRIRSKAILHISLNFLHLITQKKKKKQNWEHILFYSLLIERRKKWFCSPTDCHAFYFTVKSEFNERKWATGILLEESYHEVSVKEGRK